MITVPSTGRTLNSVLSELGFTSSKDDKALQGKIIYDPMGKCLGRMTAPQCWNYLETERYIDIKG